MSPRWVILVGLLLALAAPPAGADPVRGRDTAAPDSAAPTLSGSLWRLGLASLAVAGLLYGGSRLLRRLPFARFLPGGNGPIRIEGRTLLGPKEYLCLVRVGTRTILIGVSAGRIVPLHAWPEAEAAAGGVPAPTAWVGRGQADEPERNLPAQLRSLRARLGGQSR